MRFASVTLAVFIAAGCQSDTLSPESDRVEIESRTSALSDAVGVAGTVTGSAHLTVFGSGAPGLALRNFAVSAVKRQDGSVTGQWQIVAGSAILHGPINCVTIVPDGRSARISGLVSKAHFTLFEPGTVFAMELLDSGTGAAGEPDVTTQLRAFQNMPPAAGLAFCETGAVPTGGNLMPLPTEHGNFTIRLRN